MKYKIYQSFYKQDQINYLDKEFEPFDNVSNSHPQYMEYPIFYKIRKLAKQDNLDVWGYVSWKWKNKLVGCDAKTLLDIIEENPNYDVYIFNPYPIHVVYAYNVWEQGYGCHPHILEICKHLFPLLNIDPKWVYQPMHPDTMYYALYCAGGTKFWDGFLDLMNTYIKNINKLPLRIRRLHDSSANYGPLPDLWYFPFIQERLLSTFITINKLKVFPYHHRIEDLGFISEKMNFLKISALKYKDKKLLKDWLDLRKQSNYFMQTNWLDKFDSSLF